MADFLTKSKFSKEVEQAVLHRKMGYIEAILFICEKYSIDPLDSKKFLNNTIKEKLESEAQIKNLLPKGNALPI